MLASWHIIRRQFFSYDLKNRFCRQLLRNNELVIRNAPVLSGTLRQGTDIPRHKRGTCKSIEAAKVGSVK